MDTIGTIRYIRNMVESLSRTDCEERGSLMAGKSPATDALREYRSKILSDDVETRVTVLAEKVAEYEAVAVDRQRTLGQIVSKSTWPDEAALEATVSQLREVAQRQWAAEDAVYVAFPATKR